ncbi:hypothetical protein AVEN_230032-1 [Araneus ventricosus]|uniref:Uncharacterized protein n=1 Tax=Araneus ventricosus TaxID=182803 RepID=A0A4Y2CV76_ARAVE|nr:hypothetical protein AVEN_230032-1 [Araneus ventricosus]
MDPRGGTTSSWIKSRRRNKRVLASPEVILMVWVELSSPMMGHVSFGAWQVMTVWTPTSVSDSCRDAGHSASLVRQLVRQGCKKPTFRTELVVLSRDVVEDANIDDNFPNKLEDIASIVLKSGDTINMPIKLKRSFVASYINLDAVRKGSVYSF